MKTILFATLIITTILGCTKGNNTDEPKDIYGMYNSISGDTAFVSINGSYSKIEWSPIHSPHRFVFDSVIVNADLSFTDNEVCDYGKGTFFYKSIGVGVFGTNAMTLHFNLDGGDIYFNGVRKQ